MIQLAAYLLVGLVVLGVFTFTSEIAEARISRSEGSARSVLSLVRQRVQRDPSVFFAAGLAVALLWPLVLVARWLITARVLKPSMFDTHAVKVPAFRVRRRDLLKRLTVEEIEANEMVMDPLDAVPSRPFGHLNPAWVALLHERGARGSLWSFSSQWAPTAAPDEVRTGYVWVQWFKPRNFILTACRPTPPQLAKHLSRSDPP